MRLNQTGHVRQAATTTTWTSGHSGTNREAAMSTRKTKPTFSSMIELPSEWLRLMTITVEHKAPTRGGQTWQSTCPIDSTVQGPSKGRFIAAGLAVHDRSLWSLLVKQVHENASSSRKQMR